MGCRLLTHIGWSCGLSALADGAVGEGLAGEGWCVEEVASGGVVGASAGPGVAAGIVGLTVAASTKNNSFGAENFNAFNG